MAATVVKFDTPAFVIDGGTGVITFRWSDGSTEDFNSVGDLAAKMADRVPDAAAVRAVAIVHTLALDPMFDSPALWNGKQYTLDPEQSAVANVFKGG